MAVGSRSDSPDNVDFDIFKRIIKIPSLKIRTVYLDSTATNVSDRTTAQDCDCVQLKSIASLQLHNEEHVMN